jgi:shikimate dehydrogenase
METYALFGNPVTHSLSPLMHNAAYEKMGIDARYLSFCVADAGEAVAKIREMDIRGASVTLPFKSDIMRHLDGVDDSARAIGAVNTVMNRGGRLWGHNTDWLGLVEDLQECLQIQGKTFAILGTGGTARAAVFGILKEGGTPWVAGRSLEKAERLAAEFHCGFLPLQEIGEFRANCLINTTPVGMFPDTAASPVGREILPRFGLVVDVIYNPPETRLLREAREAGCAVLSGVGMFVRQGAEQIRRWTGMEPPLAFMREIVLERLEQR